MSVDKYTPAQVAEALILSEGVIAAAARALGCDRSTVYAYMKKHASVQSAHDEANETSLDTAESGLSDFMKGEVEGQTTRERLDALKFFLRTKGKGRGYTERTEHTGANGGPMEVRGIDFSGHSEAAE